MTTDQAVRLLLADPQHAALMSVAYVDPDVLRAARRFASSGEFAVVGTYLAGVLPGGHILDLGAGNGIASFAFARAGAAKVYALEPDPSDLIGHGAIRKIAAGLPIEIMEAWGERIPLGDEAVDVVYARQVLHHATDLPQLLRECTRVLKPGGFFMACREHVVDDPEQLQEFLRHHAVHQLAGGEHAFSLDTYLQAIGEAGLEVKAVLGNFDSVINAYPTVETQAELDALPRRQLHRRFGALGDALSFVPGVTWFLWRRLRRPTPGRAYSFVAVKPPRILP